MNAYELADRIAELEKLLEHSVGSDCREMRYVQEIENKDARIVELEKKLQESALDYISVCSQADEHYARVQELEKQLDTHFKNGFEAGKLEGWKAHKYHSTPQTKPLTNDEIREIGDECELKNNGILNWIEFARAIEERHGIK